MPAQQPPQQAVAERQPLRWGQVCLHLLVSFLSQDCGSNKAVARWQAVLLLWPWEHG